MPLKLLRLPARVLLIVTLLVLPTGLVADEGMWTFDNPPLKQLQNRYGFTPSAAWLDHLREASVRFNDGGSGSFVSASGLVLTNHHVARDQLQKVSTPEHNYAANGFLARSEAEEIKCPDLELNVLQSMEDVTRAVLGAVKPGMTAEQALEARRAEMARLEKDSLERTGLRSDIVTLYQGGEYWLYRYKRYTDVRVVFAPEEQAAFFGGDPDNFTYPRYDLDFALFRVYENGRPVRPQHFLKWNSRGAADGELVFVSGNPGSTSRLETVAQLEYSRDVRLPLALTYLKSLREVVRRYAGRGPEAARQASDLEFGIANSLKAYQGEYNGLLDRAVMAKKDAEERELRTRVEANPAWKAAYGSAWDDIAATLQLAGKTYKTRFYSTIERSRATLPSLAMLIVEYVSQVAKPDAERLPGFHDAQLESLRFELLSPAPVYPDLDVALLGSWLEEAASVLGPDSAYIKAALGGQSPGDLARTVMAGTRLADPAVRKALVAGGRAAVDASADPLVAFARRLEPFAERQQRDVQARIESPLDAASEKIGQARFAVLGKTVSPDATFTLRLSFGTVAGYPMNGTVAPPRTTLYGLYNRSLGFNQEAPFNLPKRFLERRDQLDLSTPVNFVTTNDVVGGNSGSPVVNRAGELVGLIFDGNIESLVGTYVYNEENNRAVAVHPAYIIEALRKLYGAGALADELEGR